MKAKLSFGPLTLRFESDGDDPGVGIVVTEFASGGRSEIVGVSKDEWNAAMDAWWK